MKTLKVGVIGLGAAKQHLLEYRKHPRVEVVAVADPDEARLKATQVEFDVPRAYSKAETMLDNEKLDLVSVATPNKYHCSLTLIALERGCHVLCEKPMAMNAAEGGQASDDQLLIPFPRRLQSPENRGGSGNRRRILLRAHRLAPQAGYSR
ncbi:MAG TPA: Gfo/Idh/MocA family oxidoreductase [Spirochaetia bacterium]|nr:Gfo/Idh/MocA family oxidoreductase [Spirochaetia bacterium]